MRPPWRKNRPGPAPPQPPDGAVPLGVEVAATPYGALVAIAGELDIATVPRVTAALGAEPLTTASAVVIDLTDVGFMDSTGLAALLNFQRELLERGGRMEIACPEGPARLLFDVAGLTDQLGLHRTRAEAEAAARA